MSSTAPGASSRFEMIAVVGVGLIGGSIAAAARQRGLAQRVIGIGRNAERLEAARRTGLLDHVATDFEAAREADVVVVCTPVDRVARDVIMLAPILRAGSVITDAGSTKEGICRSVGSGAVAAAHFVGAHPLAGSERTGWEHADPALFVGRICVVTPEVHTPHEIVARVTDFWTGLGMRVLQMTPEAHDRALALTSHLPHVVASALAGLILETARDLTATGFRDTTRIAAGDPDLWTAILLENAEPVLAATGLLTRRLGEFQAALQARDAHRVRQLLEEGKRQRDLLDDAP